MRHDKLSVQSMGFAISIINLVKELKANRESIISNQIGRCGTSIGANIREAQYAHGKADFISKLQYADCIYQYSQGESKGIKADVVRYLLFLCIKEAFCKTCPKT